MQTQSVDQLVGQTLGNYRVEQLLGKGRLNAVYLAQHTTTRRVDALTLYLFPRRFSAEAHTRFVMRFRKEAAAVTSLRHPHILPVYEYGEHDGYPYLVTPYMMHGSLADILKQHGRYDHSEALPLLEQLVVGLAFAHSKGFIHGTLRPSNIVLKEDGSLQVAGFGLMHMLQLSGIEPSAEQAEARYAHLLSVAGTFLAAPGYIAPEIVQGQAIDIRSDIYALGCILFELLSGRPPFEGQDALEVAKMHVKQNIPQLRTLCPEVPPVLASVVNQALERDSARRFQSVQELGEAYMQASNGAQGVSSKRTPATRRSMPASVRQERVQETPRDGLNKWQLLPPIVTGKLPAIRADQIERKISEIAPPTLPGLPGETGTTSAQAAVTLPPQVPQAPVREEPSRLVRREQVRQETARADAPTAPARREAPRPPVRQETVRSESPTVESEQMGSETADKSMVGEDPAKLIKEYAWWSQVGEISSPAVPIAQKQLANPPDRRASPAPDALRLPAPDADVVRRSPDPGTSRQSPDFDLLGPDGDMVNWTMEPMLPAAVASRVRGVSGNRPQKMSRRRVVAMLAGGGVAAAAVAVVGLNLGKNTSMNSGATAQANKTTTGTNTTGTNNKVIGNSNLQQGKTVQFNNPADNQASLLIHLPNNTFVAYERACTHVGVFVNYDPNLNMLVCPAHGAIFDPMNGGAVTQGPATKPLPQVKVQVNNDGTISAL